MTHPLENPIWNALNTGSARFAQGDGKCRFINPAMGFFAGTSNYDEEGLQLLHGACSLGQNILLFTPEPIQVNDNWLVLNDRELLQMVCHTDSEPETESVFLHELGEKDIPAMLELTELTKPGPFLERTMDFGGYYGFFEGDRLVSMAGKRLSPDPYVEVSAVCTHPEFLGKGLSAMVMRRVIADIRAAGKVPFLHVYPENVPAVKVYRKLGFESRTSLRVYLLQKLS